MLKKCQQCGFYASHLEKVCPNCGRKNPASNFETAILDNFKTPALFGSFSALIITLISFLLFLTNPLSNYFSLIPIFLISFFLSTLAIYLIVKDRFNIPKQNFQKNPFSELDIKENIIQKRLSNLSKRGKQIDIVLDKIKQNDTEHLQNVRRKLLSAREVVIGQYARYELQAKKIELARLQSNVSPYLNALHRLNEFEAANGLVVIEHTKHEMEKIRHNLTSYYAIEFPKTVQAEKENFLSQIEDTEASCDKIREAILSQQATLALRGISPIEDTLKMPSSKEIAHAVDTFNIQSTLTDFSESFEELENEYRRVQSESEVSQTLLSDID